MDSPTKGGKEMKQIYPVGLRADNWQPHPDPAYLARLQYSPGGTLNRSKLKGTYDENGEPRFGMIKDLSKIVHMARDLPVGRYNFDIEEHDYNQHAKHLGFRHYDYLYYWKMARPDCQFGYYSCHGQMDQPLHYPSDVKLPHHEWYGVGKSHRQHPNRIKYEKDEHHFDKLNILVDHYSPQLYCPYVGPISTANGVPKSIVDMWPEDSSYGFDEWKDWAGWLVDCVGNIKPVLPYIAPYVIQLDADGRYGTGYRKYPVPFFSEMVKWTLDNCDGFFLHAWPEMEPPQEQNVRRVIDNQPQ
jgi:hypothetical protein